MMDGAVFRKLVERSFDDPVELVDFLGCSHEQVEEWCEDDAEIPYGVALIIASMAAGGVDMLHAPLIAQQIEVEDEIEAAEEPETIGDCVGSA